MIIIFGQNFGLCQSLPESLFIFDASNCAVLKESGSKVDNRNAQVLHSCYSSLPLMRSFVGSFLLLALILLIKSYPITHSRSSCFEPPSSQCIFHSPYLPAPNSGAHWSLKLIWGGGSRRAVWERSWISTFNGIWRLGKNSLKGKKKHPDCISSLHSQSQPLRYMIA